MDAKGILLVIVLAAAELCCLFGRLSSAYVAAPMNHALGLSVAEFGFGAGAFFLPYWLMPLPSMALMVRVGPRNWLTGMLAASGVVGAFIAFTSAIAAILGVNNGVAFPTLRAIMGVAQAGLLPGSVFLIAQWIPWAYQTRALGLFSIAIPAAPVVGPWLSTKLLTLDGVAGLAGWQWTVLSPALPSLVLALGALAAIPDGNWASRQRQSGSARRIIHNPRILGLGAGLFGILYGIYICTFEWPQAVRLLRATAIASDKLLAMPFVAGAFAVLLFSWPRATGRQGLARFCFALVVAAVGLFTAASATDPMTKAVATGAALISLYTSLPLFWALAVRLVPGAGTAAGLALIVTIGTASSSFSGMLYGLLQGMTAGRRIAPELSAAAVVAIAGVVAASVLAQRSEHWEWNMTRGSGHTGRTINVTSSRPGQATRLLCASALLDDSELRKTVKDFFDNQTRSCIPELGLDPALLLRICLAAEARARTYDAIGLGTLLSGLLIAAIAPVVGLLVFVAGSCIAHFRRLYENRFVLVASLTPDTFDPAALASRYAHINLEPRQREALPPQGQNLVVYSGFNPFVGAGLELDSWSFATSVDKPAADREAIKDFGINELYQSIEDAVQEAEIEQIDIADWYFASGTGIRHDAAILRDAAFRPDAVLPPVNAARCRIDKQHRVRHYKWIKVEDWGGELVFSYFLRCTRVGQSLFVEVRKFILPPIADHYRQVDALPPKTAAALFGLFLRALFAGPLLALAAPFVIAARIQHALGEALFHRSREARRQREISRNPLFDYGVANSLRALTAQNTFQNYFQKSDADFYGKIIDRRVLGSIVEFLGEHGIDTSDIRDRQMTILNSGILVQGGDVRAESLAVGHGATATKVESARTQQAA